MTGLPKRQALFLWILPYCFLPQFWYYYIRNTETTQKENGKATAPEREHNMKKTKFWVEYDFIETEYGPRPYWIREFKTLEEAETFAATTADGKIVEVEWDQI